MMDDREKQFDPFDKNLRAIGRRIQRPADATDEQVRRWVDVAAKARPARAPRLISLWARPTVRRWALSAAAVAVAAVGVFLAVQTLPQSVSADDVFRQVGSTLATQPVLHLTVKDVELHGHRMDFEFMGADEGQTMFARVGAQSLAAHADNAVALNMALARDGEAGWVLVRQMQWKGRKPMGRLIPADGALLIDVPVSHSTDEAVRQIFPMIVRPRDVQALIESLRQAVADLQVRVSADGMVLLEGVITRPADLDLQMLCETTDAAQMIAGLAPALMSGMTQQDLQKIVQAVKKTLAKRMSKEDFEAVSQRLDLVSAVAMQQLQTGAAETNAESRQWFDKNLRTLLTGAMITIVYDPHLKLLRSVKMDNVGPSRGTVQLRFDEPEFNRSLLNRSRFADEPNVRTMTRDEVIYAMLLPMLQPAVKEFNKD
jgi:hypothetical protein